MLTECASMAPDHRARPTGTLLGRCLAGTALLSVGQPRLMCSSTVPPGPKSSCTTVRFTCRPRGLKSNATLERRSLAKAASVSSLGRQGPQEQECTYGT